MSVLLRTASMLADANVYFGPEPQVEPRFLFRSNLNSNETCTCGCNAVRRMSLLLVGQSTTVGGETDFASQRRQEAPASGSRTIEDPMPPIYLSVS